MAARVVVVSRMSGDTGRAATRGIARSGDWLTSRARGQRNLDTAAEDVGLPGPSALPLAVDMANPGAVDQAVGRMLPVTQAEGRGPEDSPRAGAPCQRAPPKRLN